MQVKQVLQMTSTPFTIAPPFNQSQGPGIANAAAAALAATQPIPADTGTLIANRIAASTSGAAGDAKLFKIVVPAGRTSVNLRTFGGTGNVSLYVARDRVPTTASFDRSSVSLATAKRCCSPTRRPGRTTCSSLVKPRSAMCR